MVKIPYHHEVAQRIIEQLKEGTAPWVIPWNEGNPGSMFPINPVTGTRYKGINAIYLMSHKSSDNRWLTYKQAQSLGAQVKKREKGTTIQYWKFSEERVCEDEQGNPRRDKEGNVVKRNFFLERPRVFYATVFNANQIEGMPILIHEPQRWASLDKAELILNRSGAQIIHSEMNQAFYRISTDTIHLPLKAQFDSSALYYATALHELGHWTGHSSRLDRDLSHPFGSIGYAQEELRAEISSLMLGEELGIGHDPSLHTAYIKSWIKILESDPLELFRACSDAEKIMTYLISHTLEQQHAVLENQEPHQEQLIDKTSMNDKKIWLTIPFEQKETVKELLGTTQTGEQWISWDKKEKKWFAKPGVALELLQPWLASKDGFEGLNEMLQEKTWLAIPYSQKDTVKAIVGRLKDGTSGIVWDITEKCWYAQPGVLLHQVKPWIVSSPSLQSTQIMDPIDEFRDALQSIGGIVTDTHPIMDGKTHRIQTEGDKAGEKAGFYVAYLDGVPAGYIKNNRTGIELKWKCKGYFLSEKEKALLKATSLQKLKVREEVLNRLHQETAKRLQKKLQNMPPLVQKTPYFESKGIMIQSDVYTDTSQKLTCIPATDDAGVVWTVQYINKDGVKRFAKNSLKEGCFHVVGGFNQLAKAPVIVIAEGYATASTLSEALGLPTICAFDSGNLKAVATVLREKYPDTPILIAGDDDRHQEIKNGINPGKDKAFEAAHSVNGLVVLPIFSPGEQEMTPKQYSDFNDMAHHSSLGIEGVKRQVIPLIKQLMNQSCSLQRKEVIQKKVAV